jgi:hypothetical protein
METARAAFLLPVQLLPERPRAKSFSKKHGKTGSIRNPPNGPHTGADVLRAATLLPNSRDDILAIFADIDDISNQPASFSEDMISEYKTTPSVLQLVETDGGDSTSSKEEAVEDYTSHKRTSNINKKTDALLGEIFSEAESSSSQHIHFSSDNSYASRFANVYDISIHAADRRQDMFMATEPKLKYNEWGF